MAYQPYPGYQAYPGYFMTGNAPPPDQLAQLRQQQLQQAQQAQLQQMQQAQAAQQQQGGFLWVQGEEGAKAYMVAPGASVLLMDSENSAFYIKSSDPSGMPLPLRIFDYTERKTANDAAPARPAPAPSDAYVTREEFDALKRQLDTLATDKHIHKRLPPLDTAKEENDHE